MQILHDRASRARELLASRQRRRMPRERDSCLVAAEGERDTAMPRVPGRWSVVLLMAGGCSSGEHPSEGDGVIDASIATDATGASSADTGTELDATADVGPACDRAFANTACWSTFVSEQLTANTSDFAGAVFDGRSVLFVNATVGADSVTALYDTHAPFDKASSWSVFDTQSLGATACGFTSAAFDGTWTYLAPGSHATMARYDTAEAFDARSSWSATTVPGIDGGAEAAAGFLGAVFDGRYITLAPNAGGLAARLDTQGLFDAASAWSLFDVTSLAGGRGGFDGAAFDGRYVYLAPHADAAGPHGVVARFDTLADFGAQASWSLFDATTVDVSAAGFSGAVFDGRFVYFVPNVGSVSGLACVFLRYDTQGPFASAASWGTSGGTVAASSTYDGAAFDGRYVYFAPAASGVPALRFDTQASFASTAGWTQLLLPSANISGFRGAVFDGQAIYFVPAGYSWAVRFDAVAGP